MEVNSDLQDYANTIASEDNLIVKGFERVNRAIVEDFPNI